jgi:hypothetical protein
MKFWMLAMSAVQITQTNFGRVLWLAVALALAAALSYALIDLGVLAVGDCSRLKGQPASFIPPPSVI